MEISGTVYFDFESLDCWRLVQLLAAAEAERVRVDLTWSGFAADIPAPGLSLPPGVRALAAHASVHDPVKQRTVRQALFTMHHGQGDSLDDDLTYRAAARVAGLDEDVLLAAIEEVGMRTLRSTSDHASRVGVEAVPSLVAHGSPLLVQTTSAVLDGPAKPRVAAIIQVMEDDGLWSLSKP